MQAIKDSVRLAVDIPIRKDVYSTGIPQSHNTILLGHQKLDQKELYLSAVRRTVLLAQNRIFNL